MLVSLPRVRSSRLGMEDQAAKLLVERSVRRDESLYCLSVCRCLLVFSYLLDNRLHLTRDESMRNVCSSLVIVHREVSLSLSSFS